MIKFYKDDITTDLDTKIVEHKNFLEWYKIVKPILENYEFQKRKLFPHHHKVTVWDHSVSVSFKSFNVAKKIHADKYVCAVAGLLHDFYPFVWLYNKELENIDNGYYLQRLNKKEKLFQKHGFTHAREAVENAQKYFPSYMDNKKINNSMKRHMFPLNITPPKYVEGYIITMVDKLSSTKELPKARYIPKYLFRKKKSVK